MILKLEKTRLEQLLNQASIFSKGKPLLDPVKLKISNDGVEVAISDSSKTIGVVAKYLPQYFEEYDVEEGEYIISPTNLVKAIKKVMKGVPYVTVKFEKDSIIVAGEGITIKDTLRAQEVVNIPKYEMYEGIPVPRVDSIHAAYTIELPELASLDLKEYLEFKFGKTLKAKGMMGSTVEIERDFTIKVLKEPEQELVGRYSADYVIRAVKLFKTAGIIAVLSYMDEETGNLLAGPVIIGQKYETYYVAYWINSMIVE